MNDERRFGADEQPCLSVRHLSKRFGAGCPHCQAPIMAGERFCAHCGQMIVPEKPEEPPHPQT